MRIGIATIALLTAPAVLILASCSPVSAHLRPDESPSAPRRADDISGSVNLENDPQSAPLQSSPVVPPEGSLNVTIEEAVLLALENNRALRVERLSPAIQKTFVEQELAAFEPVLSAEGSARRERGRDQSGAESRLEAAGAGVGVSEFLPTGATFEASVATEKTGGSSAADQYATRAGLSVTQALLRGGGVGVNLANLRQARLDTLFSDYEFRGFAEALVAEVEMTYWEYVLARRQKEIVEQSLNLAEQQLEDTRQRIRVGQLAETELAAAEAEVALRRESLINSRSRVELLQVRLLRLLYPQKLPAAERELLPLTEPMVPPLLQESIQDHVKLAFRLRPDLNQAQLLLQKGELEIVKTRNGLLPRMDLFVTLGKTGYSESFGDSISGISEDSYDVSAGLKFEYPVTNRAARARDERAVLTQRQKEESLNNLQDLARQDVELALIEVRRARQQVDATATTRRFQEEKLRAETAKFRVGKSTALLVAAAQRDLLASQVAEVEAVINNLNARIKLYLLEGSLLERRGLVASGSGPEETAPIFTLD